MTKKKSKDATGKPKVINVKVDAETKDKLDTLAYIKGGISLQELCIALINKEVESNADAIADVEKARAKYNK